MPAEMPSLDIVPDLGLQLEQCVTRSVPVHCHMLVRLRSSRKICRAKASSLFGMAAAITRRAHLLAIRSCRLNVLSQSSVAMALSG